MGSEIIQTIVAEISMAYLSANKTISETSMNAVAQSLHDALKFNSPAEVHEAFRRAKMVADIPTQRTLAEVLRNHRAESNIAPTSAPKIENRNPRAPWLPSDTLGKRINLCTAIKNYCAAVSDALYMEYRKVHTRHRDGNGKPVFDRPERVEAFEAPIKETIRDLYRKYWRKCACAAGYPEGAPYNLGLSAPTVTEFRAMLAHEAHT